MAAKRFLILASARSGSTALRNQINRHPDAICHGEVFAHNRVLSVSSKIKAALDGQLDRSFRERSPEVFLSRLFPEDDVRVQGAKLIFHQLLNERNMDFIHWIRKERPMPVLLWRRDLLARARSEYVLKYDVGLLKDDDIRALTPADVERDCMRQIGMAQFVVNGVMGLGLPTPLCVDFEDLIKGSEILNRTLDYLGLRSLGEDLKNDSRSREQQKKQRPIDDHMTSVVKHPSLEQFADVRAPYLERFAETGGQ